MEANCPGRISRPARRSAQHAALSLKMRALARERAAVRGSVPNAGRVIYENQQRRLEQTGGPSRAGWTVDAASPVSRSPTSAGLFRSIEKSRQGPSSIVTVYGTRGGTPCCHIGRAGSIGVGCWASPPARPSIMPSWPPAATPGRNVFAAAIGEPKLPDAGAPFSPVAQGRTGRGERARHSGPTKRSPVPRMRLTPCGQNVRRRNGGHR